MNKQWKIKVSDRVNALFYPSRTKLLNINQKFGGKVEKEKKPLCDASEREVVK